MKGRKKPGGGAANFWPGYVDAMTNVVLNLLFMVAMFGITLAVFSQQTKGGGEGETDPKTAIVSPPDATLGWPAPSAPPQSGMRTLEPPPVLPPSVAPPSALDRAPGDVGMPAIVRIPPAPLVSGPPGTAVAADGAGRAEARFAPAGQSVVPGSGSDSADVAGAGRSSRPGRVAGPDATEIVVADAFARKAGPPVTVTRRATSSGQVILTLDAETGSDPVGAFQRPAVTNALKGAMRRVQRWHRQ